MGNFFFYGVTSNEAVDYDFVCLIDFVGTIEGLDVVVGVLVGVVNNDSVRCC